jgi:hypothetical protein
LRKPEAFEPDEEKVLARDLPFEEFAIRSRFRAPHPDNPELEFREAIKHYYTIGVDFLPNLKILRYEKIENDLNRELAALGYDAVQLQDINVSNERPDRDYHNLVRSQDVEAAIYSKYRWLFEHGYYQRLTF